MGWNSVLRGEGWRLLQAGSSSMTYDDDDVWTPLEAGDYAHLGITISYQIVVLLIVVHLWLCREWPPYIPRYAINMIQQQQSAAAAEHKKKKITVLKNQVIY